VDPAELQRYRDTIAQFRAVRPLYERLGEHVQAWCRATAAALGQYPIVMGRAKAVDSFAEKICRPGKRYADPLREVTDLLGVRVIVHTTDEVQAFAQAVEREFVVDAGNSEDKQQRLAQHEFGYLSRHYILQLAAPPAIEGLDETDRARLAGLRFELQLRTLAQHLWADVYHVLGYKNEFRLPARWEREFARLAALLEECDKGFQSIKAALRTYESSYGAYLSQEELRALAERLEALLAVDPDNASALHRLLRTHLAIDGGTASLGELLAREGARLETDAATLRDQGVALCQIHPPQHASYAHGVACLRRAVATDPHDVDAWCSLGGALRRQGESGAAIDCYRRAHELDPTNPYPLGNYVAEEVVRRRDAGIVSFIRSAIVAAAERCRRQVDARVNLPWALFDLGLFSAYLGEPGASLDHYARGIVEAPRAWMIRTAGNTTQRLLSAGAGFAGLREADRLLKLAGWVRTPVAERGALDWQPSGGVAFGSQPVLVLAGGCGGLAPEFAPQLAELGRRLAAWRGTLVAGGTTSGVAALAGDLQERAGAPALRTIGYVPSMATPGLGAMLDRRYTQLRHGQEQTFSALQPLAFWEEFCAAGSDPAAVRLIGFNGGDIAAAEFRMALALGARVGLVAGSGRAADALLADAAWSRHPRLHSLALAPESVGAFLA
jgi:ppGpp synthetase/RelA/SpoT-type nucleotidyltranferase